MEKVTVIYIIAISLQLAGAVILIINYCRNTHNQIIDRYFPGSNLVERDNNAPMERYFNTLKNDLIYQHYYRTEEELYTAIEEFAYVQYNHVRPHSYNNYKTPYEARYGSV